MRSFLLFVVATAAVLGSELPTKSPINGRGFGAIGDGAPALILDVSSLL